MDESSNEVNAAQPAAAPTPAPATAGPAATPEPASTPAQATAPAPDPAAEPKPGVPALGTDPLFDQQATFAPGDEVAFIDRADGPKWRFVGPTDDGTGDVMIERDNPSGSGDPIQIRAFIAQLARPATAAKIWEEKRKANPLPDGPEPEEDTDDAPLRPQAAQEPTQSAPAASAEPPAPQQ